MCGTAVMKMVLRRTIHRLAYDSPVPIDFRDALRGFAKNRGFLAAAVLSLALGVGANTAIFSVTSALLLRPLPYPQADRLVILWNRSPGLGITRGLVLDGPVLRREEQRIRARAGRHRLRREREPDRRRRARADRRPSRLVQPVPDARRATPRPDGSSPPRRIPQTPANTALLGYPTWVRRYGSDPNVLGRRIELNGRPYQVVGVLPVVLLTAARSGADARQRRRRATSSSRLPHGPDCRADAEPRRLQHHRPSQARRERRRRCSRKWTRSPRRLRRDFPDFYPPNGGLTFARRAAAGTGRRRRAPIAGDARRRGRVRAADCVRERRESAAVARPQPAEGAGDPRGARRQPRRESCGSC